MFSLRIYVIHIRISTLVENTFSSISTYGKITDTNMKYQTYLC